MSVEPQGWVSVSQHGMISASKKGQLGRKADARGGESEIVGVLCLRGMKCGTTAGVSVAYDGHTNLGNE